MRQTSEEQNKVPHALVLRGTVSLFLPALSLLHKSIAPPTCLLVSDIMMS